MGKNVSRGNVAVSAVLLATCSLHLVVSMDKDKTLLASVNAFSEENDKLQKELEQLRSVIKDKDSLIVELKKVQIGLLAEISDHRKVVEQVAEQDEMLTQHWHSQKLTSSARLQMQCARRGTC